MKVVVFFLALVAVFLKIEGQNQQWQAAFLHRNQTNPSNGTQWNTTLWLSQRPNSSQWQNHSFARLQAPITPGWVVPANTTWNQTTHNGDVIIGQIGYMDRLLFNQTYRKQGRWWSDREKIIEYPAGKGYRRDTITAIRIYNKFLDGLESRARVLSGGVGYRYVKIKLSSPWNRGFEYLVQLFGH